MQDKSCQQICPPELFTHVKSKGKWAWKGDQEWRDILQREALVLMAKVQNHRELKMVVHSKEKKGIGCFYRTKQKGRGK